ncbi:MAG: HD domain-containing protein [Prolixibacteraceae bacterium]|jgi:uncharacterized protein|nr:HD domain-containing protein [Prolixibacteraceae bacterium]
MSEQETIEEIAAIVEQKFKHEASGHDWWHIYRVWMLARRIGNTEKVNLYIVELASLLHDIADWKFNDGNLKAGGIEAQNILLSLNVEEKIILAVTSIIDNVSYKGAGVKTPMKSIEGKVVQDADRLDAIGAVGIARTFAYGGSKNRAMYDPTIIPVLHANFEEYKHSVAPTINHFYEKLLLLKERMNTATGKQIAIDRHHFMESYLEQFFNEWEGKA